MKNVVYILQYVVCSGKGLKIFVLREDTILCHITLRIDVLLPNIVLYGDPAFNNLIENPENPVQV